MRKKLFFLFVVKFLALKSFSQSHSCCAPGRYTTAIYNNNIITIKDIYWTYAYDAEGNADTLKFDLYEPANDLCTSRPLLIWMHGGGYEDNSGDKSDGYIKTTCEHFAKKGFVCVAPNYRLGIINGNGNAPFDTAETIRAAYRATQDTKGIIRYFKASGAQYKIDTSNIYICGYSSGASSALAAVTIQLNDKPIQTYSISSAVQNNVTIQRPDLGTPEGTTGGNLQFSSRPAGAIIISGGTHDTLTIQQSDALPLLIFHEVNDFVIPYYSGLLQGNGLYVYGGGSIDLRMTHVGFKHKFVSFTGVACHCLQLHQGPIFNNCTSFLDSLLQINPPWKPVITQNGTLLTSSASSSYQWFLNGNPISGAVNQTYNATQQGYYYVQTTDAYGCSAISDSIQVLFTGIQNEITNHDFSIYPNPSEDGIFVIQGIETDVQLAALYDIAGRKTEQAEIKDRILNLSYLKDGIYFLIIRSNDKFFTKIISIQKSN